jgi:CHAD domain-containing protein
LRDECKAYRKQLKRSQNDFTTRNVHQLRVRTRRLAAKLGLLACAVHPSGLDKAQRLLKSRLEALGELRDTQVHLQFVKQRRKQFPGLKGFYGYLIRRERRLRRAAFEKVNRFKTTKLNKRICTMRKDLEQSSGQEQRELLLAVRIAAQRAFTEVVRRRQAIDPCDVRTIHRTRVAFKKFRYMIECSPPEILQSTEERREDLSAYQGKMGEIQDNEMLLCQTERFLAKHKDCRKKLRPFCRYLSMRRHRLVRSYLLEADQVLTFQLKEPGLSAR